MLSATKIKLFDFTDLVESMEINSGTGERKKFNGREVLPAHFPAVAEYRKSPMRNHISDSSGQAAFSGTTDFFRPSQHYATRVLSQRSSIRRALLCRWACSVLMRMKIGGAGGIRTHEWRFCRPLPWATWVPRRVFFSIAKSCMRVRATQSWKQSSFSSRRTKAKRRQKLSSFPN
jgi:hypothetical protein